MVRNLFSEIQEIDMVILLYMNLVEIYWAKKLFLEQLELEQEMKLSYVAWDLFLFDLRMKVYHLVYEQLKEENLCFFFFLIQVFLGLI